MSSPYFTITQLLLQVWVLVYTSLKKNIVEIKREYLDQHLTYFLPRVAFREYRLTTALLYTACLT